MTQLAEPEKPLFCPHCHSPNPTVKADEKGLLCMHCRKYIYLFDEDEDEEVKE